MASTKPGSTIDLSFVGTEPETKVKLVVPRIIYKKEGEKDMVANLRADFNERQCKCLSESITVIPPPVKKPYTEILCLKPVSVIAPTLEPSVVVVGINHVSNGRPSSTERVVRPKLGGPFTSLAQLSDDSVECVASVPPCPQAPRAPSRGEITKLMKQVPCFTKMEAPVNNIWDLFSATR